MPARARAVTLVEEKTVGLAITAGRAIKTNGLDQWVPAGVTDAAVAVAQTSGAPGTRASAVIAGPCQATAAEAFMAGQRVAPAGGGKFRVAQAGDEITGMALERAAGDGASFLLLVDIGGGTADAGTGGGGGGGGGSGVVEDTFSCDAGIAVNDVVYISSGATVDLADADSEASVAVGIVTSKPTPTSAVVRSLGLCTGLTGLTPGARYFLSTTAGQMTATPQAPGSGKVDQFLGVAKTSSQFEAMITGDYAVV